MVGPDALTAAGAVVEQVDVLVVGAGVSGIAAGVHLQQRCPGTGFLILEGRPRSGGTWDLFRYPGIRSDSDMFSFAYSFKPWQRPEAIAGAPAILGYLRDAAREHGLEEKIRYDHRLTRAEWDSGDALWTVTIARGEPLPPMQLRCRFLVMCTGYYSYAEAHRPEFPGEARFAGQIVHPQFWPDNLDHAGKRIVVIGSGATAITLVPALAERAAHVTMLQRSPGYVVARPARDRLVNWLRRVLPGEAGHRLGRIKYLARDAFFYQLATRFPALTRRLLLALARRELGPALPVALDFSPRYDPWTQRLCLDPDGAWFAAIRSGAVTVATDEIETFTPAGIRLLSGRELAADLVVSATGLRMELLSGVDLRVDGSAVSLGDTVAYKGCMFSGVPNLVSVFGYANAAWTLKAELTCAYTCRLLQEMGRRRADYCVAPTPAIEAGAPGILNLESGYVLRARHLMPRQGSRVPWKALHNHVFDRWLLRHAPVDDGVLAFRRRGEIPPPGAR